MKAKNLKYRAVEGILWAGGALGAVLLFALERHAALVATAIITAGMALASAVTGLAQRHSWLLPLLFWTALSLPIVKHLGPGEGLPGINADHLIAYPVDAVILIGLGWALVSTAWGTAPRHIDARTLLAATARLFKPDLIAGAILAVSAATALSIYPATFRAPAAFALVDLGRVYAVYVLFRHLAGSGAGPVLIGLLAVGVGQGVLCVAELCAQSNFGLWQQPGWGKFVVPGITGGWKEILVARCGGTFEPNVSAQFFQVILPFAAALFLTARKDGPRRRIQHLLLLGLTVFALSSTFSRGGWLGGGAALGVLLLVAWFNREKLALPSWPVATLILLEAVLLIPATAVVACRIDAGDSLGTATRLEEWSAAIEMIKSHPLLGVGKGNYVGLTRLSQPWALRYPVHNVYLLYWAETGLVGFLSFMALLCSTFWAAARAFRNNTGRAAAVALAAFAAFAGLGVRMLVSMSFLHPLVTLTFIALAGAVAASARPRPPTPQSNAKGAYRS